MNHVSLPLVLAEAAAATKTVTGVTLASVLDFLTQAVLVVGAVLAVMRWRWAALGLVAFMFKSHLPVVLDYWVDAFAPQTGSAALERWYLLSQIANLLGAVALVFGVRQIIRREVLGGFIEPVTSKSRPKRRKTATRRRKADRQDTS